MTCSRLIKRYTAYYRGWCLAFGEHDIRYDEGRDINWLFGNERIGMVIAAGLRRQLFHELLGHHGELPNLILSGQSVSIHQFHYIWTEEEDRRGFQALKELLLNSPESHLFLSSHFCYPGGTRIVTFASKRPLPIMYKEMQPLQVTID